MKNQNKKIKFGIYSVLFVILLLSFVSATESCFVQLNINETLVYNGSGNTWGVNTLFDSQQNLYGEYSSSVQPYDNETPQTYILKTYNGMNSLLSSYSLGSGLVVYYDNFGNETDPGGIELLNESQTSAIIPYNASIHKITIQLFNTTAEKELVGFNSSNLSCERTCKIPGEPGVYGNDSCCSGFTEIVHNNTVLGCITTNDGICDSLLGENKYNSFNDCLNLSSYECKPGFVKTMLGGCIPLVNASCGDKITEPANGETCDDGNNVSGDGCSSTCDLEGIGNCSEQNNFVLFNDKPYRNTCDANNAITYSCYLNIFTFNLSQIFQNSLHQNIQVCDQACSNGVCVNAPLICGDGICNKDGENCSSCPEDCAVCPVPTCSDGIQNQDETGIDCGGDTCSACDPCANVSCPGLPYCYRGQCCLLGDCSDPCTNITCNNNGLCSQGTCTCNPGWSGTNCDTQIITPNCSDGIQNQDETGIDCGGNTCPSCLATPTCNDSIKNQDETGIDCGGICPACGWKQNGESCTSPNECFGGYCFAGQTYPDGECYDGSIGSYCFDNSQCNSKYCDNLTGCYNPHILGNGQGDCNTFPNVCNNNLSCIAAPFGEGSACTDHQTGSICSSPEDCISTLCLNSGQGYNNGFRLCYDGSIGSYCYSDTDCNSKNCDTNYQTCVAAPPTCSDGIQNQDETGIDCGGDICSVCAVCDCCDTLFEWLGWNSCSDNCSTCITPVCGDKICRGNETCSSCPADCGNCATDLPPEPTKPTAI